MIDFLTAIKKAAPYAKVDIATIADTLKRNASRFNVDNDARVLAFVAQAAHETAGFKTLKEYATGAAYEGRTDLGNTQPGDGVKFKGRGIFQVTGRSNYAAISKKIFGDSRLLDKPELLEQPVNAALSALHYWNDRLYKTKHLYYYADLGDLESITKAINGGLNGWADRLTIYEKLKLSFLNQPVVKAVKDFIADNPKISAAAGIGILAAVVVICLLLAEKYKLFKK